jgi:thiamine transport system ATP-binding protein
LTDRDDAASGPGPLQPKIEASGVTLGFGKRALLQDVSLSVPRGAILGLVGPSGTGKTTLAKALCGLQPVNAGRISVDGRPLSSLPPRGKPILVWQDACLFDHLSVRDNIAVGLKIRGVSESEGARVDALLASFGLEHLYASAIPTLSGGERARVALARALAVQPALLILDEPFASLDVRSRSNATDIIRAYIAGHDRAAILISHAPEDIFALCDLVLVMEGARPGPQITVRSLIAEPRTGFEAQFGGYWNVVQASVIAADAAGIRCRTKWGELSAAKAAWLGSKEFTAGDEVALIFLTATQVPENHPAALRAKILEVDQPPGKTVLVTLAGNRPMRITANEVPKANGDIYIVPERPLVIAAGAVGGK